MERAGVFMGGQETSLRRIVITNLFILLVVLAAGFLSFHEGVLQTISGIAKAPVFTLHTENKDIALEIAFCGDADLESGVSTLAMQKADASLFFCPESMRKNAQAIKKSQSMGFHTGLYVCGVHDNAQALAAWEDLPVLSEDAVNAGAFNGRCSICWTLDANRLICANGMQALSEKLYDNCILLYRVKNDMDELASLIKIIRKKGYNITNVKTIIQ